MTKEFALVRIENSKFSERYSEPILKADTLEELELKLATKTGAGSGTADIGAGLGDWDDFGGLL